jgi:hypothetical protein
MGHSLNYMGSFVEGAAFSWELSDDLPDTFSVSMLFC